MQLTTWLLSAATLCALVAVLNWRRWKQRARQCRQELAIWKEALHAVAFESTNAVNALRANLTGFREVNPSAAMPQHLDEIQRSADRLEAILSIARDPAEWHRSKKQGRPVAPTVPHRGTDL